MADDPPPFLRLYSGDDEPDETPPNAPFEGEDPESLVGSLEDLRDQVLESASLPRELSDRIVADLQTLIDAPPEDTSSVGKSPVWRRFGEAQPYLAENPAEAAALFEKLGDVLSIVGPTDFDADLGGSI